MAAARPAPRGVLLRLLRVVSVTTTAACAVALMTAGAGAQGAGSTTDGAYRNDVNQTRVAVNAIRAADDRLEAATALTPTPARRKQTAREQLRKELTAPIYVRPVPGPVTQWYGYHPGVDIAPAYGTPVGAAHAGIVTFVGWQDGYGMHVEVAQADGYVTTYSHLSGWTVKVGQVVKAGQELGMVGSTGWSTGPHLHFEVHLPNGQRTDPAVWLREHGVSI